MRERLRRGALGRGWQSHRVALNTSGRWQVIRRARRSRRRDGSRRSKQGSRRIEYEAVVRERVSGGLKGRSMMERHYWRTEGVRWG